MRIVSIASRQSRLAPAAIVLLPAALSSPDDFILHGFADAINASGLDVDLLIPDLHADCYLRSTAVALLDDMLRTHVQNRYSSFWLAGVSLGGYGVMQHARLSEMALPSLSGRFLIAPYLGSREIVNAVNASGGISAWRGDGCDMPDAPLWQWLQRQVDTPLADTLCVGCGTEDRFALSSRLLESLVPDDQVFSTAGDHSFGPWRTLWAHWLKTVVAPVMLAKVSMAEAV